MPPEIITSDKETLRQNGAIVLLDVDNTLYDDFTIFEFTNHLFKKGLITQEANDQVFADKKLYEDKEINYHQFAEDVVAHFYKGLTNRTQEEVQEAGKEFLGKYQEGLMPFTRELIEIMCRQGKLIVVSGAPIEAFLPLADTLSLPRQNLHLLEGSINNGIYTGQVKVNMALEEEKQKVVQQITMAGFAKGNSFAFGDSTGDLPILESVSNPFAFEPNSELRKIADERGWPIVDRNDIITKVQRRIADLGSKQN